VSDKKAAAEREDVKLGRGIRERHERQERLGHGDDA
jgi:membrane protein